MSTQVASEYKTPEQVVAEGLKLEAINASPLVGTWKNVNPATRGMVRIIVGAAAAGVTVDAFGACTPTPCNWGKVAGQTYASTVSGGAAVAFSAHYTFSFSQVIVVAHLNGPHLIVETFTHFTDHSGRADYHASETMAK